MKYRKHDFIRKQELYRYFDFMGTEVIVFRCQCSKCGKIRTRKFIGHTVGQLK